MLHWFTVIAGKEANMVVFSHNHKCDERLVDWLQIKHMLWGLHPAQVGGPDRIFLHWSHLQAKETNTEAYVHEQQEWVAI